MQIIPMRDLKNTVQAEIPRHECSGISAYILFLCIALRVVKAICPNI